MTGRVGSRTDCRTVEIDIDKREMLSCFLIEDMTYDISVGRIQGNMGSPDKPGGLSIQLCKSEKKEFYIRYSS